MKTKANIAQNVYIFERTTYNHALDYLIGKELFKEKVDAVRAFLKEHGLSKDIVDELKRKANLEKNNSQQKMPLFDLKGHFLLLCIVFLRYIFVVTILFNL